MLSARHQNTPLRAPLGAARQALLASPSRGEVASTSWHYLTTSTDPTLPLEGRVAKLGSQSPSAAREGVPFPHHQMAEN
ncbi:hypothetical protein ASD04_06430 [Devosia sp. Root436]|nr:hypothetical protein ASD04_06430 [Devosia sp. Root436]